ncbi:DUF3970 family protein [Bacillus sp. JJ634]
MTKIRLEGTSIEVQKAIEELQKKFQVLSVSKSYKNRNSSDIRVYLNIQF